MGIPPGIIIFRVMITIAALWVMGNYQSWACSYTSDDLLRQQQQQCITRPDRSWSCQLHRCVTTQQVLKTEKAFQQCDAMTELAAANRCRLETAKAMTNSEKGVNLDKNQVETKNRFGMPIQTLVGSYYLFAGFSAKEGTKSCFPSAKLIAAGSAAAVAGSLLATWQQSRDSNKLQDQYEKLVASSHPQSAQVEAFDYLIKEQELVEKAAKRFAIANYLASGLFSAAGIVAAYGMLVEKECVPKVPKKEVDRSLLEDKPVPVEDKPHTGKTDPDKSATRQISTIYPLLLEDPFDRFHYINEARVRRWTGYELCYAATSTATNNHGGITRIGQSCFLAGRGGKIFWRPWPRGERVWDWPP